MPAVAAKPEATCSKRVRLLILSRDGFRRGQALFRSPDFHMWHKHPVQVFARHGANQIASSAARAARSPAAVALVDDAAIDISVIGVARVLKPAQMTGYARLLRKPRRAGLRVTPAVGVLRWRDVAHHSLRQGSAGARNGSCRNAHETKACDRHGRWDYEAPHDNLLLLLIRWQRTCEGDGSTRGQVFDIIVLQRAPNALLWQERLRQ